MTVTELWQELKRGQKNALEQLFLLYYADLFRYAVKFSGDEALAEDHIQDLFLNIWKRRDYLGEVTSVKTYLWTALRRSLIHHQREKGQKAKALNKRDMYEVGMQFSEEEIIIREEENKAKREALKNALNKLSPRQREIIYLRYYNGMTYEEINSITSLNYQTLRNHVYNAMKILESVMGNNIIKGILGIASSQLINF